MEHSTRADSLLYDRLKALPDDIILNIFYSLSTFLSCRRLNELLDDYTPSIYRQIAHHGIEFESHARALVRDQNGLKGPKLEPNSLRVQDIRRLMVNTRRAAKSSKCFGREIAPHALGWWDQVNTFFLLSNSNSD